MIRSMTGFGRAQTSVEGYNVTVEIRSVNHRYFELYTKIPRTYAFLEEKVKSLLQTGIARGKVEVYILSFNGKEVSLIFSEVKAIFQGRCYNIEKQEAFLWKEL